MTGNHDVGIKKEWFNPEALSRHINTFGPTNYIRTLGGVDLVVIDAVGLVSPTLSLRQDALMFLHSMAAILPSQRRPRVLMSHIPLFRPDDSLCGPRRDKRVIHQFHGISYQNLIDAETTRLILSSVQPMYVFSGDDHTTCLYHHPENVTEYTLATYSW